MSMSFGSAQASLGGWPAIGAGVEANTSFSQASGATTKPYIGFVARAARTLIRTSAVLSSASAIAQYALIRQVGNAAVVANPFVPLYRLTDVPQAQCVGGADNTVLTGTQRILFGFPVAFTGQFSLGGSDFLGIPLVLFPGDGLIVIGGTVNVTQTFTANIVELPF